MKNIFFILFVAMIASYIAVKGLGAFIEASKDQGYSPEQPIPFSHKIHAGDNKMECLYCHFNADRSRFATIPPMSLCMGCHQTVATDKDESGAWKSPHIEKMHALSKEGKSFPWIKVHNLPEHVYFPHKKHVAAGVDCRVCHGDVEEMEQVQQMKELSMGFCLNCHRDNNYVDADLGVGQPNYQMIRDSIKKLGQSFKYSDIKNPEVMDDKPISAKTHMNARTDCAACHL